VSGPGPASVSICATFLPDSERRCPHTSHRHTTLDTHDSRIFAAQYHGRGKRWTGGGCWLYIRPRQVCSAHIDDTHARHREAPKVGIGSSFIFFLIRIYERPSPTQPYSEAHAVQTKAVSGWRSFVAWCRRSPAPIILFLLPTLNRFSASHPQNEALSTLAFMTAEPAANDDKPATGASHPLLLAAWRNNR
jgi:hypothetical protein